MNTDMIFDAMDYIDDDMLEDVDALRTKKKAKPNRTWMRYVSAAACVCLIVGVVYMVDRTGLLDKVEMEDCADQENMSGESFVHRYIRADIVTPENGTFAVTELQEVTAIYDILQSGLKSEAAADYNSYSENDKNPVEENADGAILPEGAGGITESAKYTITLVNADGEESLYTLTGKVVCNENTGETFRIKGEQYNELMKILNGK